MKRQRRHGRARGSLESNWAANTVDEAHRLQVAEHRLQTTEGAMTAIGIVYHMIGKMYCGERDHTINIIVPSYPRLKEEGTTTRRFSVESTVTDRNQLT